MSEGVVKRGSKWYFYIEGPRDPITRERGKKIWEGGFRAQNEAKAERAKAISAKSGGTYVPKTRQTFAEYAEEWLKAIAPTVRPATHYSYARNLRLHVIPVIGSAPLAAVDGGTLNQLYAALLASGRKNYAGGGLSPRTVRYIATILHRAFKDAVRWGRLARNPVDTRSDPPKASAHQTPERMPWTAEQATIFLDDTRSSRHWTAYFVLATTGLRRGECLGLRWSDLDLDAGRASIRQTVIAVRHTPMFGTPKTAKGSALGQARRWHRRSTARAPEAAERRAPHDGRRMAGPRSGVLPR